MPILRDVSGKIVKTSWAVVHHIEGIPNWIDGPYPTRRIADDIKLMNDDETRNDPDVDKKCKTTVVRMSFLVPWEELFGETYAQRRARDKGRKKGEKITEEKESDESK